MRPILRVACALVVLVLSACATGPVVREAVDDQEARALWQRGAFREAAAAYERLAQSHRRQRDALLLQAAESLREEGDSEAWSRIAAKIKRKRLLPEEAARLDLLFAEAALVAGDAQRTLDLATLPEAGAAVAVRAGELRARALDALHRPLEGVAERVLIYPRLSREERDGLEKDILDALVRQEIKTLAAELGRLPEDDARRPWLERALRLRGAMPSRVLRRPGHLAQVAQRSQPARPADGRSSVALLVPLTGSLANAGGAIRDGFLSAYYSDAHPQAPVRVYDTGERVEGALQAYRQALAEGATRIVGPLAREQVAALFAATDGRAAILALNHPENGAPPPEGSQQFGLLPDDEAAFAAEHAYAQGLRRVAVLASMEEWGERAALAFRAQFEYLGGEVVAEARIPTQDVDYAKALQQALQPHPDMLFLALRATQGRLLVPQVRIRTSDPLPLIATSHIYSGSPNRGLDRDLNGVLFCDSPWLFGATPGLPARTQLAQTLPAAATAPRLFAFGMDAYRLLGYLDPLSRQGDAYLPGATGQLTVDRFGRVRRWMAWQQFVDGVPVAAEQLSSEVPVAP